MTLVGGKGRKSKVQYEARLREVEGGKSVGEPSTGVAAGIEGSSPVFTSLLWTPDETAFVTAYGSYGEAKVVQWWDARTLRPVGEPMPASGDLHYFDREGKSLFVVSKGEIGRWDVTQRKRICLLDTTQTPRMVGWTLRMEAHRQRWFAVHPDSASVLYANANDTGAELWDLSGDAAKKKHTLKHRGPVEWVAMSRDGKQAATATGSTPRILVWDLATGRPLLKLPCDTRDGDVRAMEFSPDGKLLAAVTDRDIQIWRLEAKK